MADPKITKIENPCQEILLKQDMGEEEMNYIDPHAANPARNGLGEVGNILQQEVGIWIKILLPKPLVELPL